MNKNKERFVQDIFDTFDQTKAYTMALFSCALFGGIGLFFSIIMMESVLPYVFVYSTYLAFFGLSVFCIIGGIGCIYILLKQYKVLLRQKDTHQCIRYLPLTFASAIPGFIMFMYCSLVENAHFVMPISYISFFLCIYAIVVIAVSYALLYTKLEREKAIYQKKTLRYVECLILIILMIGFFVTLLLNGSDFEDIPKIVLITFMVTFMAYQCGRTAVAKSIYDVMNIEFMDYQKLYHDGTLGEVEQSLKARVTIVNDGQMDKALHILEEFGFEREHCMNAIIKNIPFYTFDEKMYYDIVFMRKLLMRLSYENISFLVDEWKDQQWQQSPLYSQMRKLRYVRRKKFSQQRNEEVSKEKSGWIFTTIVALVAMLTVAIYGIWVAIFPVNYFRPVRWSSFEQIQNYYKEMTYPSGRTIYHMISIWIVFIGFLCIQPLQDWYCYILDIEMDAVWIVFGILFIGEMFVFPVYLKKLKNTVNKSHTSHNYEKRAFIVFIALLFLRSFMKGWQKSLSMLVLLMVAVEMAKSIYITIRYIMHRKESLAIKNNELYEIVEVYDDDHPQKEIPIIEEVYENNLDIKKAIEIINQYKHPVIQLDYSHEPATRYSSQLGGIPYLLKGQDIPGDEDGPFILLIQINFDEIKGHSISDYPQRGMLQFFIKSDDVYGCDFDSQYDDEKFAVVYHEEVDYNIEHLQNIDLTVSDETPIIQECRLELSVVEESGLSSSDFQFVDKIEELCPDISKNAEYLEILGNYYRGMAEYNKLGGQGYFLQEDTRKDESTCILLQLVSDGEHMMWGDYGVCQFYIKRDDLKNKNFDNVIYSWECY